MVSIEVRSLTKGGSSQAMFSTAEALELFGHVASIVDIVLDIYLTVDFLRSDNDVLWSCGVASAFFLSVSLTLNSIFALQTKDWGFVFIFAFPFAFPVALAAIFWDMLKGFATHYVEPITVLLVWPLIIVCAVDALTNPNGYANYVKRGLIQTVDSGGEGYKQVLWWSIILCCAEDIPAMVIQGISTTSSSITPNEKLVVYFSLVFSIYRICFEGFRKLFIVHGRIEPGAIMDFEPGSEMKRRRDDSDSD